MCTVARYTHAVGESVPHPGVGSLNVPVSDMLKRFFVGRALRSERLGETMLPKRIALPVFASDALSSNAYAKSLVSTCRSTSNSSSISDRR